MNIIYNVHAILILLHSGSFTENARKIAEQEEA